jgi:acetyl-CoA carboxylase alpha subunit
MDYINGLLTNAYEIHGDRHYVDDHAIVCYLGFIGNQKVLVIGEQKGRGTKDKLYRNFGMPSPEGYRKALRAAKMADKFQIPILMLVDTPATPEKRSVSQPNFSIIVVAVKLANTFPIFEYAITISKPLKFTS